MNQKLEIHQFATFIEKELLIHLSVEILLELHVTDYIVFIKQTYYSINITTILHRMLISNLITKRNLIQLYNVSNSDIL